MQPLLAVIHDQHRQFGHVLDLRIGSGQGNLQVGKRLAHLLGKVRRELTVGILPTLPRGVDQPHIRRQAGHMGVAIARRVIQPGRVQQLHSGVRVLIHKSRTLGS